MLLHPERGKPVRLVESDRPTLGQIGFEGRYDYGALGPVTNLASQLSTYAAGGEILVGPRVYAAIESRADAAPIAEIQLKGFARPVQAYKVLSLLGT